MKNKVLKVRYSSSLQEHTEGCTGKTEGSKDDDEDEEEEEDPSAIDLGVLCQKAKPGVTSGLRVNNYGVTCPKHIRWEKLLSQKRFDQIF